MLKRKRKTEPNTINNRFFEIFAGEFVKIFIKANVKETASTEEGHIEQEAPLAVIGYLLDYDSKYYYLGDDPSQASIAVAINQVMLIQEVKNPDAYDALLEQADIKKMM